MLHGKQFTLRTDHISLLSLQNAKEPARRVLRWLDELAKYKFTLEYISGPNNVVADAISRAVYTISTDTIQTTIDPTEWFGEYKSDPLGVATLQHFDINKSVNVSNTDKSAFEKYKKRFKFSPVFANQFQISNGVIYYNSRIFVPKTCQNKILTLYHDHKFYGGHFGSSTTHAKIFPLYYWPKLNASVTKYVESCFQCQIVKQYRPKSHGFLQPLPIPEGRWLDISMDFATGLPISFAGNDMIMIVVDRFSKRAHFFAT